MDYVQHDTPNMTRHLAQALQLAGADDHAARSRACLVAALGFHHAGRQDLAMPWYHATRRHAASEGDDATLSALMHNMAWLRGNHAREASIFGAANADEVRQALMGAESTEHFDAGLRTASLSSLVPILRAQILVVLDRVRRGRRAVRRSAAAGAGGRPRAHGRLLPCRRGVVPLAAG